ncbi:heme ABC transporter ATP-binding protein [Bacillus massiliglaciei]|uniref:heme ABC transporter ATP-binding protein n=1 Tax=Bacillus massiliglaciei TaxID=1816693 RepID=UPI000A7647D0|nr:heme ABC transporter ATP-binding protein [Bacillus massiliglaciei]
MLEVTGLSGGYDKKTVLDTVSFHVNKGEMFGILGPNGSGKTTLLKMLSGVLNYQKGIISIKEKNLSDYTSKQLAKVIAVLPQHSSLAFSYTVKETVSLGRYAHQTGWFHSWNEEDEFIVQTVMNQTGVSAFQDMSFDELSGGEQQRVLLAQALAQQPEVLILDEPTNHLDLSYQKGLLDLLSKMAKTEGLTVVSIFHDLNLAGLYCDRLMLLENGKIVRIGLPDEVLQQEHMQQVYQTKIVKQPHPELPKPQMFIMPENDQRDQKVLIDGTCVKISQEMAVLRSPIPLKTMSLAGTGWHRNFVNWYLPSDSAKGCLDLRAGGFNPDETVSMTAAGSGIPSCRFLKGPGFSVFIMVSADQKTEGSCVNSWIFINGQISEGVFLHSLVTATEAKMKALQDLHANAASAGSDSILIAATQKGLQDADTGLLMQQIQKGIYDCIMETFANR